MTQTRNQVCSIANTREAWLVKFAALTRYLTIAATGPSRGRQDFPDYDTCGQATSCFRFAVDHSVPQGPLVCHLFADRAHPRDIHRTDLYQLAGITRQPLRRSTSSTLMCPFYSTGLTSCAELSETNLPLRIKQCVNGSRTTSVLTTSCAGSCSSYSKVSKWTAKP